MQLIWFYLKFAVESLDTTTRSLTFSTAAGLVFEWAPLFGGRAGERKIVEFMSELGVACAPIEEWEDVAKDSGTRVYKYTVEK